jgi:predicted RNase H-like HicB family nuclease
MVTLDDDGETMNGTRRFTAMIYSENGGYVALCPELDVASQGESVEEASANLREAVELFLDTADPSEVALRTHEGLYVAALEVRAG